MQSASPKKPRGIVLQPAPFDFAGARDALNGWIERAALAVWARREHLALPLILVAAAAVRAFHLLREPFPLNDGGLFYEMARDIQRANFALPSFTSYNDGHIPFAYSPLSLYLAALGDTLTPASLEDMFRVLPFLGAMAAVWAFWRLALVLLPNRNTALAATAVFALVPRSFIWLIMGGGLPRGLALALTLLAVREAYLLTREAPTWKRVSLLALFSGLTLLTHLETATFLALTVAFLLATRPRAIAPIAAAGAGGLAIAAPWLLLIVARHGIDPFVASSDYGGSALNGGLFDFERILFLVRNPVYTDEQFFPIVGALAVVGAFYAVARGKWLLPAWWILVMVIGMRAFPTYAAVPVALLAGLLIGDAIVAGLKAGRSSGEGRRQHWWVAAAAVIALVYLVNGSLEHSRYDARFLRAMPNQDVAALHWIDEEVPSGSLFAVVPVTGWYADYASEWFPALAGHESVGTTQGYEWVDGEFEARLSVHESLRRCISNDADCLAAVMRRTGATHLYVPSACCDRLASKVQYSARFDVLYNRGGALVAELRRSGNSP